MSQQSYTAGSDNDDSRTPEIDAITGSIVPIGPAVLVPRELATTLHPSWDEVVAGYLDAAIDSPNTRRAYGRHLRRAGEALGVGSLHDITGAELASYRAAVTSRGWRHRPNAGALACAVSRWSGAGRAHLPPRWQRCTRGTGRSCPFNVITQGSSRRCCRCRSPGSEVSRALGTDMRRGNGKACRP